MVKSVQALPNQLAVDLQDLGDKDDLDGSLILLRELRSLLYVSLIVLLCPLVIQAS